MENERREAFKKYKELRVYFNIRKYTVIQYNNEGMEFDLPFDWFKFSSRGVTIKDKNSGKEIHFKYSSVNGSCSSALIIEDVELYTPFIKEDDEVKFITWKEWDKPFTTINDIVVPWDDRLSEHGTDLEFILSKTLLACEAASFAKAKFKQNVGYRADERVYYIGMVYGECYCRDKNGDRYHIKHNYYASENTFNVSIQHLGECNGTHEISFKFDNKHSLEGMKIKHGSMDGILRFMDIDNNSLREYINKIRDYINMKLGEHNLATHIDDADEDGYTQTWNISSRCDIITKKKKRPTAADIFKANERAKAYDTEHTYFSTVVKYLFDEFGLTTDPSDIKGIYQGDVSNNNENIFVSVNKDASIVKLSVYDKLDDNKSIVVKMEFNEDGFIHDINVESSFKDCYDLSNGTSLETCISLQGLRRLVKSSSSSRDFSFGVLDDQPFRLDMDGDVYGQISKECKRIARSIRNSSFHYTPTDDNNWEVEIVYRTNTTVTGGILRIQFTQLYKDNSHQKVQFVKVYVDNMYKQNICHVDIEFTPYLEVHSISINPAHDKFVDTVNTIKELQIRNLMSELFRLFNGPFA